MFSALLAAVFGAAGATVSVPYVALGAGPIYDTLDEVDGEPVIQVEGEDSYETSGSLSLTTVSVADDVTMFNALARWVSGSYALAPREQYFEPGVTEEEIRERNLERFEHSQDAAEVAALSMLGYPVDVFVAEVREGEAAEEAGIPAGAELLRIDGAEVTTAQEVQQTIAGKQPGEEVAVTFRDPEADGGEQDGSEQVAEVELGEHETDESGFLGVGVTEQADVDFSIDISLADVGGPSAGLMFAVAIVDRMTEEDLIAGRHVAGTGEIAESGEVGPIGGIGFKVSAAGEAGADTFLVPEANCGEAVAAAPDGMTLIEVGTLDDAVTALASGEDGAGQGAGQGGGQAGDLPRC